MIYKPHESGIKSHWVDFSTSRGFGLKLKGLKPNPYFHVLLLLHYFIYTLTACNELLELTKYIYK